MLQQIHLQELMGAVTDSAPASGGAAPAIAPVADAGAAVTTTTGVDNEDIDSTSTDDWGGDLLKGGDDEGKDESPLITTTPVTEKPAITTTPVTAPATVTTAPVVAPAVTTTTPVSVTETPVVAAPAPVAPPAPAETAEQRAAREAAAVAAAQKVQTALEGYYAIPEEDASRLQTEPELVMPKLAAKMHQAILSSVQQMMAQQLPTYVRMVNDTTAAESAAKNAFLEKWPQLKGHEAQVLQVGEMFRRANPKATPDVAIAAIGKIVSEALGIATTAGTTTAPAATTVVTAPAFTPGGGGAGGRAAPASAETNEFTRMASESWDE